MYLAALKSFASVPANDTRLAEANGLAGWMEMHLAAGRGGGGRGEGGVVIEVVVVVVVLGGFSHSKKMEEVTIAKRGSRCLT